MEYSAKDLHSKVENLTAAVLATIARETLLREIVDIERNDILAELNEVKKLINTSGPGTVGKQAQRLGLVVVEPNRINGQYAGMIVALDNRACLVKYTHTQALELPFTALAAGQENPKFGDSIRMGFKDGVLSVSVGERISTKPISEKS